MILGRLGIRGKLNLLLLLPLVAVVLVAVPFVIGQIDNARSAARTADSARHARELGGLIWELQRERLLTAAYLASQSASDDELERQHRTVNDAVNEVRSSLGAGASDELTSALTRLGSLNLLRQSALRRGASLDSVARTYHAVIGAVIDAVRLVPQRTSDAEGTRQLTALEAMLRANEQSALRGMALIVAAVNPQTGKLLLEDASAQAQMFTERFVQQADVAHAGLVVRVEQGDEGRRVDSLVEQLNEVPAHETFVADALSAVESQSGLRRLVQDRVSSEITDAATGRADSASTLAWTVGLGASILFVLVAILAILVSRSIANPLRRLTKAASSVADLAQHELVRVTDTEVPAEQVPRLSAIDLSTKDELGELAAAFNRVQATAAMLVERQAVTRRNVSLMFANVAQRTQNLVGRQLTLVDELERNEQDTRLLASLYRLDHLSTRLRRNADNLLVVAGSRDETKLGGPTELAIALRSALAEIEDYQRVRLEDVAQVTLAPSVGSDLIMMFAELLENATSFSPPDSPVEVGTAFLPDGGCLVSVVDHGIGMPPERLVEENRRLVERERLDVAPTSELGLFVVGRLARRHGLAVDLTPTAGGGVTVRVFIPPTLFSRPAMAEPMPEPAAPSRVPVGALPVPDIPPAAHTEGFSWFPQMAQAQRAAPVPIRAAAAGTGQAVTTTATRQGVAMSTTDGTNRAGLRRRVAGAQLPGAAAGSTPEPAADRPKQDADALRTTMDDYQAAIARAAAAPLPTGPPTGPPPAEHVPPPTPPPEPPLARRRPGSSIPAASLAPQEIQLPVTAGESHGGLSRRVPGANLAPGLRNARIPKANQPPGQLHPTPAQAALTRRARDPDAERAALDAFTTGLARAGQPTDTVRPPANPAIDPTKGSQR